MTNYLNRKVQRGFQQSRLAFTLIEMSIVIAVVGLLMAGIFLGQDLLNMAAVRSQITQLDQINGAVSTFKTRYNALPGDMDGNRANKLGFTPRLAPASCVCVNSCRAQGDGNGIIEQPSIVMSFMTDTTAEPGMFWVDLTHANGLNIKALLN